MDRLEARRFLVARRFPCLFGENLYAGDQKGAILDLAGVEEQFLSRTDRTAKGVDQRLKPCAVLPLERQSLALRCELELTAGNLPL